MIRFSPRPNRAGEICWRGWSRDAFDEAVRADRPLLLNLTAVWCHWCHLMDETTYSEPTLIRLLNEEVIPIRVDADHYPHVQDRYVVHGWPTNAFLTPTGEVLWAGTYVPPEQFRAVADGVLGAWKDRRAELGVEIERRRRALEAARGRRPALGLVRRESADDVLAAVQDGFDRRNGGFGTEPKFPRIDVLELLFVQSRRGHAAAVRPGVHASWLEMAAHTLDGMLAGELWDRVDGGFFRYATAPDWTAPRFEKMLDVNGDLLRAYATGAAILGRRDWREVAERTVAWVDRRLGRPDGLWGGSQEADEVYSRLDAEGRHGRAMPRVDLIPYTDWNARWIRALADAGSRLGHAAWIERAATSLETLIRTMSAPCGLLFHYRVAEERPGVARLLTDTVEAGHACIAVAQATGRSVFVGHARSLMEAMKRVLWADEGGFYDYARETEPALGALRYRDRPFETNASAARLLIDLALATGERGYRAIAERTLDRKSVV